MFRFLSLFSSRPSVAHTDALAISAVYYKHNESLHEECVHLAAIRFAELKSVVKTAGTLVSTEGIICKYWTNTADKRRSGASNKLKYLNL